MWSLHDVMESRNMAIIGASRDPQKPGAQLIHILRETGFQGKVAGVNPQGGEVWGVPLYRKLEEIPFPVELATFLIPPAGIPGILADCARKGVKGVVISSEGFAEAGDQGAKYQEEVKAILRSTGMRGFGPNTLGLINTATGLTTSYLADRRMLEPGPIGLVTQSGIFVGALLRYLSSFPGFQISKGLGLGNKVDVDESEALSYLMDDDQTRIIGMYLEGIRDGRLFAETARKAAAKKPVLLLKGGRTPEGARATASHTASMAMQDPILEGVLRQAGVLRLYGMDEFIDTLKGFVRMPLPLGPRLAIVTYSGAQGIMTVDKAIEQELQVPLLSEGTRNRLSQVIPTQAKILNPVDLYPDMLVQGFEKVAPPVLQTLLEDDDIHGIIFISFPMSKSESYQTLVELIREKNRKPVFFSLMGGKKDIEFTRSYLEDHQIPCFDFPEMAVRVFGNMWKYAKTISSWGLAHSR
jgi:acetate---CoA ligase (ADP-forming)